jgi:SagB-type dehydrogenase family enzyme
LRVRGSGRIVKVRRSPHLLAYWHRGRLIVRNYATNTAVTVTPFVCSLLDHATDWISLPDLQAHLGTTSAGAFRQLANRLVASDLLEQYGQSQSPKVRAMASLDPWNPEAGFFHTATRDVRFLPAAAGARVGAAAAEGAPMPQVVKRYRGVRTIDLPKPGAEGEFAKVLKSRRTWRRFSKHPIDAQQVGTLLGLTSGIQQWVTAAGQTLALKTSPSGGARHSIETYIVIRDVEGLTPGVYHYAPDRHALERIRGRVSLARMREYLPNSGYFADASVMVFFTAVFARILWRYPYSRAYRAALVEAGHLCQTFCLTATSLGLAPYCVMGLADSLIERDLGIDGIRESVLYAAGAGRPPAGKVWAPLPRGTLTSRPNKRLG